MVNTRKVSTSRVEGLYVAQFSTAAPRLAALFVHGGPGGNSALFDAALAELSPYTAAPIAWTLYDQRGCGRSELVLDPSKITHAINLDDFSKVLTVARAQAPNIPFVVVGHSYGARLAFDYFRAGGHVDVRLVMLGRGRGFWDSLNMSVYLDVAILRQHDPAAYKEAYALLKESGSLPHACHAAIIRLFKDRGLRTRERMKAYWGDVEAMDWATTTRARLGLSDDDAIYRSVTDSLASMTQAEGGFNPSKLPVDAVSVIGFFDLLMAGPVEQGVDPERLVRFMGSGHYPHFEEPARLVQLLLDLK